MYEQYTLRLYKGKEVDDIQDLYKQLKDLYPNKNVFLTECIRRGTETIKRDLLGAKQVKGLPEIFDEIGKTMEKLEYLIRLTEKSTKESLANIDILEKIASCNYNLLIQLAYDKPPKDEKDIEDGDFDDLPERLVDLLNKLIAPIIKDNGNK